MAPPAQVDGLGRASERCLAAGANAYHIKPVDRSDLLAIVRDQLAAHSRTNAR